MEPAAVPKMGLCDPKAAAGATGACAEGLCCGMLGGGPEEEEEEGGEEAGEKDNMIDDYICMASDALKMTVVDEDEFGFNKAFTLVEEDFKCFDSAKKLAISGAALIASAFYMS